MVRYRSNDYSVPVAFGHREVWIKGFVGRVVIAEIIADHPRSYDTGDMVFNPVHYLALIERKIMSFDQAAPLQNWELPEVFATLQRLLEARQGKAGKREYVQVLRLLERFELDVLHAAIKDALRMGAISFDAIKHLLLCGWNDGRDWIWMFTRSCPEPISPQRPHPPTWACWREVGHDRCTRAVAGPSPQDFAPANLPA